MRKYVNEGEKAHSVRTRRMGVGHGREGGFGFGSILEREKSWDEL